MSHSVTMKELGVAKEEDEKEEEGKCPEQLLLSERDCQVPFHWAEEYTTTHSGGTSDKKRYRNKIKLPQMLIHFIPWFELKFT